IAARQTVSDGHLRRDTRSSETKGSDPDNKGLLRCWITCRPDKKLPQGSIFIRARWHADGRRLRLFDTTYRIRISRRLLAAERIPRIHWRRICRAGPGLGHVALAFHLKL